MKKKELSKRIAIILSIILLILNICLYIKMKSSWSELSSNQNSSYESAGLILEGVLRYGALLVGVLLIPKVWLEYFLINLFMKLYNDFDGLKRLFLCLITLVIILIIFFSFITTLSSIIFIFLI